MAQTTQPPWVFDYCGSAAAGCELFAGADASQGVAIATPCLYQDVYDLMVEAVKHERSSRCSASRSQPRAGVHSPTIWRSMDGLDGTWTPCGDRGRQCNRNGKVMTPPTVYGQGRERRSQ